MQKKKFDLTSDIIKVNLGEQDQEQVKVDKKKSMLLTISVDEDMRKEFKTWCARKGLKMNEAFIKGFNLLKKQDYT